MKIRIFALARDLGLDSKVLIDLCEEAGVKLRNALATISEEERDIVVAYLRRKGTPGAAELPTTDMAPVREQQSSTGRVRVIGATGRGTGRPGDGQSGDAGGITDDDLAETLSAESMDDGGELAVESAEPVSEVIEAV
ncbi:MAG TPA: translation initiation factor IF-2, partial [Planctomycetaceae bacterium]|nr:translation initiation factor IF-2 [Planctomycetaceae bacterium]